MKTKYFKWSVGIILITLVAIFLPACSGLKQAEKARRFTIVIAEDPPSFNATLTDTGYDAMVMELVMLGLSDIDPNGEIFPELAAELPTVETVAWW